jgi:TPP-dependent pyruvate/acetoin dehydrogenase alpha subunit
MSIDAKFTLESLSDPKCYTEPLILPLHLSKDESISILKSMLLIRYVEQKIAELIKNKTVKCPCHLAVGQEAIAVGVSTQLKNSDRVFGNHRSHGHYLALGGCVYELLAEVLGRSTGCAGGMGGSMHIIDKKNGFLGSVPIVAGTIPLAAGAALAAKLNGEDNIGVCFFGDGATEEGAFHETLNLASKHKLPLLFVCENNLYSSHLDIGQRQPSDTIARFAKANRIAFDVVDGNNIFAVEKATKNLVDNMRDGNGPGFLEAVTYRWLGHVGANEDIDVGLRRSTEMLVQWKRRDPIKRMVDAMIIKKWITKVDCDKISVNIKKYISTELEKAMKDSYPDENKLLYKVYCE